MESQRTYTADPTAATGDAGADPEAFGRGGRTGTNGHDAATLPPAEAFREATARFGELKEYASLYVAAKLDGLKLTLRKLVLFAVLGVIGAVAGVTMLVTAAVYVMSGLAGAIGEIFPQPYELWAGRLIVGALVLGGTIGGVIFGMKWLTGSSRKRTIEKYENRKRQQRDLFGHDAQERAREQAVQR